MKRLIAHIGAHKTATTLIQQNLRASRKALRAAGIELIIPSPVFTNRVHAIMTGERQGSKWLLHTAKTLHGFEQASKDYLISFEGFSGMPLIDGRLYPHPERLAKLLSIICKEHQLSPRIIVYLRRQDDFIVSWYIQQVKTGLNQNFSDYFSALDLSALSWCNLLDTYTTVFGKTAVEVRFYEDLQKDVSAAIRLFLLGYNSFHIPFNITHKVNTSLTPIALELSLLANRLDTTTDEKRALRRCLESNFHNGGLPALLTDDMRRRLVSAVAGVNAKTLTDWAAPDIRAHYAFENEIGTL